MRKFIYTLLLAVCAVGCKIDDIDTFGEERYIHFGTIGEKYAYSYSFLYAEGKEEVDIELPVRYSGRKYDSNKSYSVSVVADKTTAKEGVEFFLPENIEFKGNSYEDVLKIKLKKTARMDTEKLTIHLQMLSNDNFQALMKNALEMDIQVTNVIDQPLWWNGDVEDFYLGKYSDKKFELFVKNIYSGDYGKLDADNKRFYALKFKKWLNENPDKAVDEDNNKITVPVIG